MTPNWRLRKATATFKLVSKKKYELPVQLDNIMHVKIKPLDIFELRVEVTSVESPPIDLVFTDVNQLQRCHCM